MEGDLRVYHGIAFPERLMMLIMNMLAPCLICGRFGCMFAAAAVRSVRRTKNKERTRERLRKEVVSLFGFVISRNICGYQLTASYRSIIFDLISFS